MSAVWVGLVIGPTLVAIWAHSEISLPAADNNFWVAAFTFLLVAITGLLVWVTYQQVKTARATQRAYVSINPAGIELLREGLILGHVVFDNAGHLPAGRFRWRIKIHPNPEKDWVPPPLNDADLEKTETVLPVGAKWKMGSPTIEKPSVLETNYLFVWGRVEYRDGFDQHRFTNFCHRYRWQPGTRDLPVDAARTNKWGNEGN